METHELRDRRFTCLEGCGFCCTFQPEVSRPELARLRDRVAPAPVAVTFGEGRTYLQLQNKCGACTLLTRRGCSAYEARPAHCRYFPFHVHFAEHAEVYVNYTCRGVEHHAGGDLKSAFDAQVTANAQSADFAEHERRARETYGTFKRQAMRANAWDDVDARIADALNDGARIFTAEWLMDACARAGDEVTADELVDDALAPFEDEDITARPFYLAPDLQWVTFARAGGDLRVFTMDETGDLTPTSVIEAFGGWEDPTPALAEELLAYLRTLATRRIFAGSVYALVDDSRYKTTIAEAVLLRIAEIATDLVVRSRVLRTLGTAEDKLADETARFYDSAFLDSPSIGGFL